MDIGDELAATLTLLGRVGVRDMDLIDKYRCLLDDLKELTERLHSDPGVAPREDYHRGIVEAYNVVRFNLCRIIRKYDVEPSDVKYPEVEVRFVDGDDVPELVSRTAKALKQYGVSDDEIQQFRDEAIYDNYGRASFLGDFSGIIAAVKRWVTVAEG